MYHEVQSNFHSLGYDPNLQPINHRILSILAFTSVGVTCLWIFLFHEADTAEEYMESVCVNTICTCTVISMASTILIAKKLFSFFNGHNEQFLERLRSQKSKAICEATDEFVEKWCKIGMIFIKHVVRPCILFPKVIVSLFKYLTTDAGNDAFDLPFPIWCPYDWKNPFGYLVVVATQFFLTLHPSQYIGCFMCLAFGAFVFTNLFITFLKNELQSMNKMANTKKYRKNVPKKFAILILRHANIKQLASLFSRLCEIMLTIIFLACLIVICAAMLLIQIEISHNTIGSIGLLVSILYGGTAFGVMLFICELGQRLSFFFEEIDKTLMQMEWYLFPIELQQVLPTVMQCAQIPLIIKCFGNVQCAREQFKIMVKTAYSYFMMLRNFYK